MAEPSYQQHGKATERLSQVQNCDGMEARSTEQEAEEYSGGMAWNRIGEQRKSHDRSGEAKGEPGTATTCWGMAPNGKAKK